MCGIAGAFRRVGFINSEARMTMAMTTLKHRGPDDEGFEIVSLPEGVLGLVHTRLSIIDLSSAGRQPMRSRDGRYTIIFNGELYNYKELRGELGKLGYIFISKTDTEVLLNSWIEWGEDCLHRLMGMFAFVVFDNVENTLTCVRDAFGIKPFFYFKNEDEFVFASEISALQTLCSKKMELDLQRSYDYLVFGHYDDQEQTFFKHVKHLLPGHVMSLQLDRNAFNLEVNRWYWPDITERNNLTFSQAAENLRELFLRNVSMHLRSDVSIGAALSGGIDSSAVVCAMRYVEPDIPIHTFSFIAKDSEFDEEKWINRINSRAQTIAHRVVVSPRELVEDIDDMIRVQGEPFGSTSIYAQYRVFRLARESGITVILDGQGADELLAGYDGYPRAIIQSLLDKRRFINVLSFLRGWSRWPGRSISKGLVHLGSLFVPDKLRSKAMMLIGINSEPEWLDARYLRDHGVNLKPAYEVVSSESSGRRLMEKLRYVLTVGGLTYLLRHSDRNSMRFSIESRVPFLTTELANFVLNLPEEYLVSNSGETKKIFRAAMRGIVPDTVLNRQDKIGFQTPEKDWLAVSAPHVRPWIQEAERVPFIKHNILMKKFDGVMERRIPFNSQVWRWINFVRWHDTVF